MTFFTLVRREISTLVKRRKLILFILLFGASAYSLLVGNLYRNQVVTTIPLVICDEDQSSLSRSLSRYIMEADRVQVISSVQNEKEAYALLDKKEAEGLIIIPPDFSKKITRHEPVSLLFLTDGTNSLYQNYAMAPVQEAAAQFSAEREMETAALEKVPYLPAAPVYPSLRIKENPTQSYSFFYLYGVTITAAQIGLMIAFAESLYEDMKKRTFRKISILKLLLAKEITMAFLSTAAILPAFTIIIGFFHMPYKGALRLPDPRQAHRPLHRRPHDLCLQDGNCPDTVSCFLRPPCLPPIRLHMAGYCHGAHDALDFLPHSPPLHHHRLPKSRPLRHFRHFPFPFPHPPHCKHSRLFLHRLDDSKEDEGRYIIEESKTAGR